MDEQEYREASDMDLTARDARAIIEQHHCTWHEFTKECGEHATYAGKIILDWLNY